MCIISTLYIFFTSTLVSSLFLELDLFLHREKELTEKLEQFRVLLRKLPPENYNNLRCVQNHMIKCLCVSLAVIHLHVTAVGQYVSERVSISETKKDHPYIQLKLYAFLWIIMSLCRSFDLLVQT